MNALMKIDFCSVMGVIKGKVCMLFSYNICMCVHIHQARSVVNQWGGSFPFQADLYIHVHSTLCSERTIKLDAVTEPCMFC